MVKVKVRKYLVEICVAHAGYLGDGGENRREDGWYVIIPGQPVSQCRAGKSLRECTWCIVSVGVGEN
jgi:hypothetical protein